MIRIRMAGMVAPNKNRRQAGRGGCPTCRRQGAEPAGGRLIGPAPVLGSLPAGFPEGTQAESIGRRALRRDHAAELLLTFRPPYGFAFAFCSPCQWPCALRASATSRGM